MLPPRGWGLLGVRHQLNYIRFSVQERDSDSGHATGILVAGHTLRDDGDLDPQEHQRLREVLAWFNEYLMLPEGMETRSTRRAISWFKPEAVEFIRKMWELKSLLELHGHHVNVLRTTEPGAVIYEDDEQVVAVPPRGVRF